MQTKLKNSAVDLTDMAIGIVVLGIIVSIGANILINVRDTNYVEGPSCGQNATGGDTDIVYTGCDSAWQLGDSAAIGLAEYGNWFDIIVIVGVAAVILSLIFMAFGRRDGQGSMAY